ncbi:hypothetical protein GCM10015535_27130 [Streptomyces gelaticus]|uniref:MerR family transcriptional regulator n=1 Tax=Streptomyces gelaticus TaxID=285446 RepID=A0ABQ2W0L6_9ACTN|nr:hypothetical protein [Streptomyces gelaticus]GGV83656.1 hypothetical protein GCM10015535_27130 [Streptomyces gelaticus]
MRKFQQAGLTLTEIGEFQRDRPRRQAVIRSKLGEIEQHVIDLDHAHQLMAHALLCSKADILLRDVPAADGHPASVPMSGRRGHAVTAGGEQYSIPPNTLEAEH